MFKTVKLRYIKPCNTFMKMLRKNGNKKMFPSGIKYLSHLTKINTTLT